MDVYPWILHQRSIDVQSIVTAPTPIRNKCELTFGYQYSWPSPEGDNNTKVSVKVEDSGTMQNMEGTAERYNGTPNTAVNDSQSEPTKVPAVGFMVTGWAGGVSFSNSLPNIPSEVGAIVEMINAFLLSSQFTPYDCTNHSGFWRILTVRVSRRTQECMIVIQHNSPLSTKAAFKQDAILNDNSQNGVTSAFAAERQRLIAILAGAELPSENNFVKVTSIFFQEFSGLSNPSPEHPVQVSLLSSIL